MSVLGAYTGFHAHAGLSVAGRALNKVGTASAVANEMLRSQNNKIVAQSFTYEDLIQFYAKRAAEILRAQFENGIQQIMTDHYADGNKQIEYIADNAASRMVNALKKMSFTDSDPEKVLNDMINAVGNRYYDSLMPMKESTLLLQDDKEVKEATVQDLFERATPVHKGMLREDGKYYGKSGKEKKPGKLGFRVFENAEQYYNFKNPSHSYFFKPVEKTVEATPEPKSEWVASVTRSVKAF